LESFVYIALDRNRRSLVSADDYLVKPLSMLLPRDEGFKCQSDLTGFT
jgi:hypothetical protein